MYTGKLSIDHRRDGVIVITIGGDLEGAMVTRARQALAVAHAAGTDRPVVLDLSDVTHLGPSGERVVRDGQRVFAATGGRLVVVPPVAVVPLAVA